MLDAAETLADLTVPPGNRLEKLAYPIPSTRKKAGHYYIYLSILVER